MSKSKFMLSTVKFLAEIMFPVWKVLVHATPESHAPKINRHFPYHRDLRAVGCLNFAFRLQFAPFAATANVIVYRFEFFMLNCQIFSI